MPTTNTESNKMTTVNNLDMASCGTVIELNIYRDLDRSQSDFAESITQVNGMNVFTSCGNFDAKNYEKSFNVNCTAQELVEKYFLSYFDKHYSLASVDDLEELQNHLGIDIDEDTGLQTIHDAIYNNRDTDDYVKFMSEHFDPKHFEVTAIGYCQGDYRTVIIPHELLTELGLEVTQEVADEFKDEINHLYWDAPITATLTVDGEEYNLEENLDDSYDYEHKHIIKAANIMFDGEEKKDLIIEFLENNLPKTLVFS